MASSQSKKGGKKVGRILRSPSHSRYNSLNQRKVNKIRKLKKHLKKCSKDTVAKKALKEITTT